MPPSYCLIWTTMLLGTVLPQCSRILRYSKPVIFQHHLFHSTHTLWSSQAYFLRRSWPSLFLCLALLFAQAPFSSSLTFVKSPSICHLLRGVLGPFLLTEHPLCPTTHQASLLYLPYSVLYSFPEHYLPMAQCMFVYYLCHSAKT